jgi:hypothetical protein
MVIVDGSDCYETRGRGPSTRASRNIWWEVDDQSGKFMANVQIREVLTPTGGTASCPAGTTVQGGQCIGTWSSNTFHDFQILGNEVRQSYNQSFQVLYNGRIFNVPINGYQSSGAQSIAIIKTRTSISIDGKTDAPTCGQ